MGGRGGSYSRSSFMAVSVTGADGTNIDLSGSPLHYGGNDPNVTGSIRKAVEEFENKRWKNKIEFARLVDANGNVIEENRGGKGSVRSSISAYRRAAAMTHNHPRTGIEAGHLGGTFSTADLNNFVRFNQTTSRATAAEGTYSISKVKGFNGSGFKSYYTSEHTKNFSAYKAARTKIDSAYKSGQIKYSDYRAAVKNEFNKFLVNQHNSLRAGQTLYGYHYTLERR